MSDNAEKDAPPVYGCCQHCTDYDAGEEWCDRAPHDDACVQPYCSGGRGDVRPGQLGNALLGDHGQPETAHRPQAPTEITMHTHALTPGSATTATELPVVDADEARG